MALIYKVRWELTPNGKIMESDHNSEKGAQNKARLRSKEFGTANYAGFDPSNPNPVIATPVFVFEGGKLVKKNEAKQGRRVEFAASSEGPEDLLPNGASVQAAARAAQEAQSEPELPTPKPAKKASPEPKLNQTHTEKETTMAKTTKKVAEKPVKVAKKGSAKAPAERAAAAPAKAPATKKSAAKAPKALKKTAAGAARGDEGLRIAEELKCREGTVRHKLAVALGENFGEPVSTADLLTICYGDADNANRTALGMVLKGIRVMIDKEGLAYEVVSSKIEGVPHITLAYK